MIPERKCKFSGCGHQFLETTEEVDIGLCTRHIKQFQSQHYLALVCWYCGEPLDTFHKHAIAKGVEIKDDYIFSKTCPHCDDTTLIDLQYVTITNTFTEPSLFISVDGALVTKDDLRIAEVRSAKA